MDEVWISSLHNLHCPQCGVRLIQRAARCPVDQPPGLVYVGEIGTLACPAGHPLPSREALYAYREEHGHPPTAPVTEVTKPLRFTALRES